MIRRTMTPTSGRKSRRGVRFRNSARSAWVTLRRVNAFCHLGGRVIERGEVGSERVRQRPRLLRCQMTRSHRGQYRSVRLGTSAGPSILGRSGISM
jgi:hypothetical protein